MIHEGKWEEKFDLEGIVGVCYIEVAFPLRLVFNPMNQSLYLIQLPALRALAGQVRFGVSGHAELRVLSMNMIGGSSFAS